MSPSFSPDGSATWSLDYGEAITVNRSVLASQLAFPDKGGGVARFFGAASFICMVLAVIFLFTPYVVAFAISFSAIFVFLFIAGVALGIHSKGRPQAQLTWGKLYYCFRDNVVYMPGDTSVPCAPPEQMRTILQY
jgi:hypothetical protein